MFDRYEDDDELMYRHMDIMDNMWAEKQTFLEINEPTQEDYESLAQILADHNRVMQELISELTMKTQEYMEELEQVARADYENFWSQVGIDEQDWERGIKRDNL